MAEKCIQIIKNIHETATTEETVTKTINHTTDAENKADINKPLSVIESTSKDRQLCALESDDGINKNSSGCSGNSNKSEDGEQRLKNQKCVLQKRKDLSIVLKSGIETTTTLKADHQSVFPTTVIVSDEKQPDNNGESDEEVDEEDDPCIDSDSDIISTNSSIEQPSRREIDQVQSDCEKIEIYLETPVVDDNNMDTELTGCPVVNIMNSAKPKRLSDEFFSADDGDEEDNMGENFETENEDTLVNIDAQMDDPHPSSSSQHIATAAITMDNDVQSLNAIERMDFAEEQQLNNSSNHLFCDGILIGNNALISNSSSKKNINRLNLELINQLDDDCEIEPSHKESSDDDNDEDDDEQLSSDQATGTDTKSDQLTTTPTSTRRNRSPTMCSSAGRSNVKLNLESILSIQEAQDNELECVLPKSNDRHQQLESIIKNDKDNSSLNDDRDHGIFDSVSMKSKNLINLNKKIKSDSTVPSPATLNSGDEFQNEKVLPSTSSSSSGNTSNAKVALFKTCKYMEKSVANDADEDGDDENDFDEMEDVENEPICDDEKLRMISTHTDSKMTDEFPSSSSSLSSSHNSQKHAVRPVVGSSSELPLSNSSSGRSSRQDPINQNAEDDLGLADPISLPAAAIIAIEQHQQDHDLDDDMWADCEEGSETEEVCTCRNYAEDEVSSEDELPSRDVDLSGYTNDDILQESSTTTPRNCRKRRITDTRIMYSGDGTLMSETCGKRIALDSSLLHSSPRSVGVGKSLALSAISPSVNTTPTSTQILERRTPRLLIPTKDNPPPELCEWLIQFQRWSNAERLLALDRLIEICEPTQVRHMMKVIEPQFQRDFISLLPKELALQVLSYLQPKDLLRAAQTCRSWRFLADDNLLWKEKCKQAAIIMEPSSDRPKRGRAGNMPPISSAWKAAYIRQHTIEMNWRTRPIRSPKVLKGHDDHVITCLQFCGNRIVSGSDDNTLKVWSAITGKCLRTLVGHTGGVWSSQMAGTIIISGSTDRTLKVWNADSGQCLHTLYGHTSTVRCMHLHGNKVVSGSRDATLRVWDVNEGTCLHVLVGHLAAVRCVQYDGRLVVSGAYDYMVKVWNPERQECLHTLQGHTNRVYSLQFDGIHVVSGSLDTSIRVWDAETGACKHTLMGHQSLTSGMELRSNILVSGNADSTVKVWDIITGQCLQTLSGSNKHQSAVTCLQFNSRFVITSSDDGTVKLWDVKTGDFIRNLVSLDSGGSGGVVWRIRANDTKLICAVGSRNGTEETKLMVLDFDVEGACLKCS